MKACRVVIDKKRGTYRLGRCPSWERRNRRKSLGETNWLPRFCDKLVVANSMMPVVYGKYTQQRKKLEGCALRITSGRWGSIPLTAVPGDHTRPTGDKVKEAMFQMIGPYFDGGWVLDAFAGSGALAWEALSRGAERAVLVEKNRRALETILKNMQRLGAASSVFLMTGDAERLPEWLDRQREKGALKEPYPLFMKDGGQGFQYVFFDPPYRFSKERLLGLLNRLKQQGTISTQSIIVLERPSGHDEASFWEQYLVLDKVKTYGVTDVLIGVFKNA